MTETFTTTWQHNQPELVLLNPWTATEDDWREGPSRQWAREHRLLEVEHAHCAHALYRMYCPGGCQRRFFDHVRTWLPWPFGDDGAGRVFMLSHVYDGSAETIAEAKAYAKAHGLTLYKNYPFDDWYGNGTTALRFSVDSPVVAYPIEWTAAGLLTLWPPTGRDGKISTWGAAAEE